MASKHQSQRLLSTILTPLNLPFQPQAHSLSSGSVFFAFSFSENDFSLLAGFSPVDLKSIHNRKAESYVSLGGNF